MKILNLNLLPLNFEFKSELSHFATYIFTQVHLSLKKISFDLFTRIQKNVENTLKKIFCSQKFLSEKFP